MREPVEEQAVSRTELTTPHNAAADIWFFKLASKCFMMVSFPISLWFSCS
jgi:hypothetical protein